MSITTIYIYIIYNAGCVSRGVLPRCVLYGKSFFPMNCNNSKNLLFPHVRVAGWCSG